jgi:hypothetical protein
MSYDEWIDAVIRLGQAKRLVVYYTEDVPRWGRRIGHFAAYDYLGTLRVWAGAGEELVALTPPEKFTELWPVGPDVVMSTGQYRATAGGYVPWLWGYGAWRAISALLRMD